MFFLFVPYTNLNLSSQPRFDAGPVLNQELHQIPDKCTAEELGAALATKGAHLVSCWSMPGRKWLRFLQGDNLSAVFVFFIAAD